MANSSILLVEDSDSLREVLEIVLRSENFDVTACRSAEEAVDILTKRDFSCILSDFKLPQRNGLQLLEETRRHSRSTPYIIMTAYGSIDIAVQAMKLGANDFITKPFEPAMLCSMLRQVIEHRRIIDRTIGMRTRRERRFLTRNVAAQTLLTQARKVARVDTPVLLLGESGTGKELIARMIHEQSPRHAEPFIAVNCAALPPDLLESEFFGHEAGAFTGATQSRSGVFELASRGTIFLDETGDMPLSLQVKLLRALQDGEVKKVGGTRSFKVAPRIIAATNHNIEEDVLSGHIREDFYYRIAVITLTVPPLRDRREDISLLADYFLDYFCSITGREPVRLDPQAEKILLAYSWPGNARELENVIERAVVLAADSIRPEHLGINLGVNFNIINDATQSLADIAAYASRKAEIELITRVLAQTLGNKSKAAQILGVSYKTLLNKVKEYNIQIQAD